MCCHILIVCRALSGKGSKPVSRRKVTGIHRLAEPVGATGRHAGRLAVAEAHGYKPLAPIPGFIFQ
jgi:hypothetical protein